MTEPGNYTHRKTFVIHRFSNYPYHTGGISYLVNNVYMTTRIPVEWPTRIHSSYLERMFRGCDVKVEFSHDYSTQIQFITVTFLTSFPLNLQSLDVIPYELWGSKGPINHIHVIGPLEGIT